MSLLLHSICQIVTEQPRFKEMAHTLHISMGECPKFQEKSFKMTIKFDQKYEEPFFVLHMSETLCITAS